MLPPFLKYFTICFWSQQVHLALTSLRAQADADKQGEEQWRGSKNQENSVSSSAIKPWADTSVWRSLVLCRQWPQAGNICLRGTQRLPQLTLLCGQPGQVWGCKGYGTPVGGKELSCFTLVKM